MKHNAVFYLLLVVTIMLLVSPFYPQNLTKNVDEFVIGRLLMDKHMKLPLSESRVGRMLISNPSTVVLSARDIKK